jgi:hypothetical protein
MTFGICVDVGTVALGLGLLGLFFDLAGASLIVAIDISRFDSVWRSSERIEKAKVLQNARRKLFQENGLNKDDDGFELVRKIILDQSESDFDPVIISAPSPGQLGGGGNVFISGEEGDDEPHDNVGSHSLVDGWIEREIEDLEKGFRDYYRRVGMWLLIVGFSGQIISYLLRNFRFLGDFLTGMIPC